MSADPALRATLVFALTLLAAATLVLLAAVRVARLRGGVRGGARAGALDLTDAGIRIDDGASVLRFGLEMLPSGRAAFRAETHCGGRK